MFQLFLLEGDQDKHSPLLHKQYYIKPAPN